MKRIIAALFVPMFFSVCLFSQDIQWPRQMTNNGSVLTVYQPQVQNWDSYMLLDFRMAFSLTPFQDKEVVGVVYMLANTDVNMDNHRVTISNMNINAVHFPYLDEEKAKAMEELVRSFLTPDKTQVMSVEQIVACTPKKSDVSTVKVNNDPPIIFTSTSPTILLQLEGQPVKSTTNKDGLDFIINSNYPLFFDKNANRYLLYDGMEWQKSNAVNGPWEFTSTLPNSLLTLVKDTNWKILTGTIPPVSKPDKKMPKVFYSDQLAELILFDAEPVYQQIPGTQLKFATNTNSEVFVCATDGNYYYETSGRWFSSNSLNGPWVYATDKLPADFKKIPSDNPAAAILEFVPGTPQAEDAVLIAQIPTQTQVDATQAAKNVKVAYSGEPKFDPIASTTLYYAVNTNDKVIKVSDNAYYLCYEAIWFVSTTPNGPWSAAATIPSVIYQIPPTSPVYNVTYVTQSITSTNIVVSSYTAGYTGVFVMGSPAGAVVIAGTGFYTPPFFFFPPMGYPVFYPHPATYGCYAYHPYPYGGVAYHASYNPATGTYGRSATAYGPYGSARVGQAYNPYSGTYARGGSVSTPYGTRSGGSAYNPYTGSSAITRQGSNANAQWGATSMSNGHGQYATAGHVTTAQGTTGAIKTNSGDMYAAKDGQVYKNTGGGWENAANGNMARSTQSMPSNSMQAERPSTMNSGDQKGGWGSQGGSGGFDSQDMDRQAQDRQRGNDQSQRFSDRSSFGGGGGSFGGGGFGGGGGRSFGGRRW